MRRWFVERFGIVRLRQVAETIRHRLSYLPVVLVLSAVVVSQITLAFDRRLDGVDLPDPLATSVAAARPVLGAIAGGLITTFTLLLSMMLVAIQLASSNFSPRTLRNWLGDRTLRWSIAVVLATTVFCLMALRSVGAAPGVEDPVVTVLVAVGLALVSLIMVIRAVDHVAGNMQVGSVANQLVDATLQTLEQSREALASPTPTSAPRSGEVVFGDGDRGGPPGDAIVIEAPTTGFVQQIDEATLSDALPDGSSAWLVVTHGDHVTTRSPLVLVAPGDGAARLADHSGGGAATEDDQRDRIARAFALGETRTMQQDVGFGLAQLSDIAVRALSPGVNDPETASGVVLNLGEILRVIWSLDSVDATVERDGRTIHRRVATHEDLLRAALDPIRRHGRSDPNVLITTVLTVQHLRDEVGRCELAGPVEPLDGYLRDLASTAETSSWLDREIERFEQATGQRGRVS